MKTFQLKHLPDYLILHIKRFTKNNFFVEKNPTIVNFPVKYDRRLGARLYASLRFAPHLTLTVTRFTCAMCQPHHLRLGTLT